MKRIVRTAMAIACAAVAALATSSAQAHDAHHAHHGRGLHAPSASVFPPPHDPWRGWGLRSELPRRVGPPRFHDGVHVVTPTPRAVWVPGQWVWDGFTWMWWPGHWVR